MKNNFNSRYLVNAAFIAALAAIALVTPQLAKAAPEALAAVEADTQPVTVPVPDGTALPPYNPPIIAPTGVPQTITTPLGYKRTLRFDDEFDAITDKDGQPYIDRHKWQTTFWQGSSQRTLAGNMEAQYYVDKYYGANGVKREDRINPFSCESPGILTISATKVREERWKSYWMGKERCFASGLLISDGHFTFEHGYVEGRFKLPDNRGSWPAFWLLEDAGGSAATPEDAHPWPPEVDVFEFFGHRPTKHSAGFIPKKGEKTDWHFGYNEVGLDISKDFHTWAFEWDSKQMVWLFDGKVWAKTNTTDSFNKPMYILVNLAVGGKWYSEEQTSLTKTPVKAWEVDEASMPWKMQCDYVRVYQ